MRALGIIVSATICCVACGGSTAEDGSIESGEQAVVVGTVRLRTGDCMPVTTPERCKVTPVSRRVVAFDARKTDPDESTPERGSAVSGADGHYELHLPPARYSLFLEEPPGSWYANSWTNDFVALVELENGEQLQRDLTINYATD